MDHVEIKTEETKILLSDVKCWPTGKIYSCLFQLEGEDLSASSRFDFLPGDSPDKFFSEIISMTKDGSKIWWKSLCENVVMKATKKEGEKIAIEIDICDDDTSNLIWHLNTYVTIQVKDAMHYIGQLEKLFHKSS